MKKLLIVLAVIISLGVAANYSTEYQPLAMNDPGVGGD